VVFDLFYVIHRVILGSSLKAVAKTGSEPANKYRKVAWCEQGRNCARLLKNLPTSQTLLVTAFIFNLCKKCTLVLSTNIEEYMQTQEIGDVVKEHLRDYPTSPSQRIARIIFEKRPDLGTQEQIRTCIRYYRGSQGIRSRELSTTEEFSNPTYELPVPYAYDSSPFIVQEKSALLLPDLHFPVQDNRAIETAITWGIKHRENHPLECIILTGDVIDAHSLSHFIVDPNHKGIEEEMEDVKDFLHVLKDAFNLPIYYKFANHERRYENYIFVHASKLAKIKALALELMLHLSDYNCIPIKNKRVMQFGELNIIHGDEIQKGVSSPVNPARTLFLKCKAPTIGGHSHVTSEHSGRTINRKLITCWSTGALCDLQPDWNPLNDWNHGFAYVSRDEDIFRVVNLRIENGTVY
jgi:hypothetical protein